MPRVPVAQGPQVQEQQFNPVAQQAPDVGAPARALGQALGNVAETFDRIAARDDADAAFRVETAAKADFLDFYDKARTQRQGEGARGFKSDTEKWWADAATKYGAELNPRAKKMVGESLARARLGYVNEASNFERSELDRSQVQAWTASKMVEIDRAARSGDPLNTAAVSADIIRQRNAQQAAIKGWSPETLAAQNIEDQGKLHAQVLSTIIEQNNLPAAKTYLDRYADQMDVNHLIKGRELIKKQERVATALAVGVSVVQDLNRTANPSPVQVLADVAGLPRSNVTGTDLPALTAAVRNTESGGRQFGADGKLLQGPPTKYGTAKGDMQVLDGTNKSPGYGVLPARDDSPEERSRVGRDYLGAMLREFKGDVPKALAAYNWGPDNVAKAVAKYGDAWLDNAPQETKDYVTKTSSDYVKRSGSGGVNAAYARPTLEQVQAEVRRRLPGADPETVKLATEEASRQYEVNTKAVKQREEEAEATALRWIADNGARFSQLPPKMREALAPKALDNVMAFSQKVARGDDITNAVVYNKLATDDKFLKEMSDAAFYSLTSRELSQSDAKQMADRRGRLLNPTLAKGDKPGDLDFAAVNSVINNRLAQLKIDPTPKDGSSDAERVATIRKTVYDQVLNAQLQSGKKLDDAAVAKKIDELFATNVTFQNTFLGFDTSRTSQRLLSMRADDIPSDVRNKIKEDFKARNVLKPTDAEILSAYINLQLAQQRAAR